MAKKTQKLSIRLLREGFQPEDAVRENVQLSDWPKIKDSKIALGTVGGLSPKWAGFLELTKAEASSVINLSAFGVLFVSAAKRWFAISFGLGHVKLEPAAFEQDFGLRVVMNSVDPLQLKSADVRTPDENTLSRRSQTSRGSDQTAFAIDVERDIVRGLAGKPKDPAFASRVAGSDTLSLDRKATLIDVPDICSEAFTVYQKPDYRAEFGWIDQIRHVRDGDLIKKLNQQAAAAVEGALVDKIPAVLNLAYPVIYDPEKAREIRYKGFGSGAIYADLDMAGYIDALKKKEVKAFSANNLHTHSVHEVDDDGKDAGGKWSVGECLVFETDLDGHKYVLSGGRWYRIASDLAKAVADFFATVNLIDLPEAEEDENEATYNGRISKAGVGLLCLDRKLVKPSGASSPIEACDFISLKKELIHIKDQTSSSRLSHLFNQGTVSARVLKVDGLFRDGVRKEIAQQQVTLKLAGFDDVIPTSTVELIPGEYIVVYAVLSSSDQPKLPFFSLVTFRQSSRELQAFGYKFAFSWIKKPAAKKPIGKAKRKKKA